MKQKIQKSTKAVCAEQLTRDYDRLKMKFFTMLLYLRLPALFGSDICIRPLADHPRVPTNRGATCGGTAKRTSAGRGCVPHGFKSQNGDRKQFTWAHFGWKSRIARGLHCRYIIFLCGRIETQSVGTLAGLHQGMASARWLRRSPIIRIIFPAPRLRQRLSIRLRSVSA